MNKLDNVEKKIKFWNMFLNQHENAHFFHTKEMHDIIYNTNGLKPIEITCENANEVTGLALGEITSIYGLIKRTTYYAEPLYNGDLNVLDELLQQIIKQSKGVFIEIRPHFKVTDDELNVYIKNGFQKHNHLNALLPLSTIDACWNNLADDKKKGVLNAQKEGLTIVEDNTIAGVELFYLLVNTLYKREKRIFKSKDFFMNLLSCTHFHFLFVYSNGIPIATQLYYEFKNVLTAYYTATDSNFKQKHAGDLLIWELIKRGIDKECTMLDLGGGGNPDKEYGVREYKKRFGATCENIGRLVYAPYIIRPFVNKIFSMR